MAICADSRDDVNDLFVANGSQAQCIDEMRKSMGPPERSVEWIEPRVVGYAEKGSPNVWFLVNVSAGVF